MAQCVARLLPFPRLVSRAALGRVVGASNVASRCMSIASGACYVPHPAKRKLLPTQKVFTALCMPGGVTFVCCGTVGLWQRTRAAKTLASFPPTVPLSVRRECAWGPPCGGLTRDVWQLLLMVSAAGLHKAWMRAFILKRCGLVRWLAPPATLNVTWLYSAVDAQP